MNRYNMLSLDLWLGEPFTDSRHVGLPRIARVLKLKGNSP